MEVFVIYNKCVYWRSMKCWPQILFLCLMPVPLYLCLGNGNPLQYSCLENPMDRGAWRATVHGVAKSRTRLSDFTSLHFRHREEKGTTEDEMAGWHHWLDGRESEWTPGVGDGQGGLACCDSWGLNSWVTELNWTELNWMIIQKELLLKNSNNMFPVTFFATRTLKILL